MPDSLLPYQQLPPLQDSPSWPAFVAAAKAARPTSVSLNIIEAAGLSVDLSTQLQSPAFTQSGLQLLEERALPAARAALFQGGLSNPTEKRAALHTALRASAPPPAVADLIKTEQERVRHFVNKLDAEQRFSHVLHIGIGGSDWGPKLAIRSLGYFEKRREIRFVANIDAHAVQAAMQDLDPQFTLVIVSSKSFSTTETLHNAERVIGWLRAAGLADPYDNLVAVTANPAASQKMGFKPENTFGLWDWVGGRYSVWSSIGLPIALTLGNEALDTFRAGAAAMDQHFLTAPFERNAPVQMALIAVANRNGLDFGSLSIAAYDARLEYLAPYLQQLEMESLGKTVDTLGRPMAVDTGSAVWGMPGTDGQHTFFQWLHQGTKGAPVDFIICKEAHHPYQTHHRLLWANCLGQREALLHGKTVASMTDALQAQGKSAEEAAWLARHNAHPGGRPSTLIVLPRLDAHALGALLALYEHKVFVQGVIWGINPFDQWGVEYGKVLAKTLVHELEGSSMAGAHDPSTAHWVAQLNG
ncbi:MAG: glucose-6-phosphate isomerase [Pigmentiphaga sp.]|nr:glucose-6-phosphate isomerase [Pigmentiphaga sp.]